MREIRERSRMENEFRDDKRVAGEVGYDWDAKD
jgi:hypothetical protein